MCLCILHAHVYVYIFYRTAPPVPHNKRSSDKKVEEKSEPESSINSSVASTATNSINSAKSSLVSSLESCPLASPPSRSDVFLYEHVDELPDSLSGLNPSISVHSRESSTEKEHASFPPVQRTMVPSESLPSFTNHLASDKTPGKKRGGGLKKLLSRNSKKKLSSLPCECNSLCNSLCNAL